MEKDDAGGFKDKELDELLSAADKNMLEAIRKNVDLGTGFATILDDLASRTASGRPDGSAEGRPSDRAQGYRIAAGQVPRAAHKIHALSLPGSRKEPLRLRKPLAALVLAAAAVFNVLALHCLSQNHESVGASPGINAPAPQFGPAAGAEGGDSQFLPPARRQVFILDNKVGASASLGLMTGNAGIGGDPVVSYVGDSRSGPVLLLSGFPANVAINVLSIRPSRPCGNCVASDGSNRSLPAYSNKLSASTAVFIAGVRGRVVLRAMQDEPSGRIYLIVTSFPGFV